LHLDGERWSSWRGPLHLDGERWSSRRGPLHLDGERWSSRRGPLHLDGERWSSWVERAVAPGRREVELWRGPLHLDGERWSSRRGPLHLDGEVELVERPRAVVGDLEPGGDRSAFRLDGRDAGQVVVVGQLDHGHHPALVVEGRLPLHVYFGRHRLFRPPFDRRQPWPQLAHLER
jgi:hypothetical protein